MEACFERMNMHGLCIMYGMTELSPVATLMGPDDPFEKRISTIGRVAPMAELKIIDEQGTIVPVGEKGEICVRGYLVMKGYWDDEEKTAEAVDDAGWMHSGDLGQIDEEGYVQIVGRVKDLIIRGGENISPKEIEEAIGAHKLVRDVQVVGTKCERLGEDVCAWVVPQKPVAEVSEKERTEIREALVEHTKDKLAHFKQPKYLRLVDEFPLTVTGKVKKNEIRDMSDRLLAEKSNEMMKFCPYKNK
jgi:fatty-acyl-CoA synthase